MTSKEVSIECLANSYTILLNLKDGLRERFEICARPAEIIRFIVPFPLFIEIIEQQCSGIWPFRSVYEYSGCLHHRRQQLCNKARDGGDTASQAQLAKILVNLRQYEHQTCSNCGYFDDEDQHIIAGYGNKLAVMKSKLVVGQCLSRNCVLEKLALLVDCENPWQPGRLIGGQRDTSVCEQDNAPLGSRIQVVVNNDG